MQPDPHARLAIAASPRVKQPLDATSIASAALEMGVTLRSQQAEALAQYAASLLRWNAVYNLTARRSPSEVLTHHLLDSLAIVPHILRVSSDTTHVLDVGAGGGLPGIPLAIAAPQLRVTLIDKVQKKVAFLLQAKLDLELDNVECVQGRVEALQPQPRFDIIVARAFASLSELVRLSRHVLAHDGWWCAMKGVRPDAEIADLNAQASDVIVGREVRLHVPHLDAERHLVLLRRAESS